MSLDVERAVYQRRRREWIDGGHLGRWVVIRGEEVLGVYDSLDEAMAAGYERYGLESVFMARQIAASESPITVTRRTVHVPRKH